MPRIAGIGWEGISQTVFIGCLVLAWTAGLLAMFWLSLGRNLRRAVRRRLRGLRRS